jgi:hypothetical protein
MLFIGLDFAVKALAQEPAGLEERMNVLKVEVSQPLYPASFVASFERIMKPYQSLAITAGYEQFPPLVDFGSTIYVRDDLNRTGFKVGAEYRFYLKSENKFLAPHGLYFGPYMTYHNFYNKRDIGVHISGVQEVAQLETDFVILNIGFQLGHQFVINNRWTIDVVTIGPAISNYRANMKLNGTFTFDKDQVQNEILLKLLDRFPLLDDLLTDKEISSQGRFDRWAYGWRFQLMVGYHFGSKRS